jgi:asparagine synthase (glutamine-hydrolysing)
MCGICGIFNTALDPLSYRERISRMSERLAHRGPDSHGQFALPFLALAIRRLSIIDLKTGEQPLQNEAGDVTVVFNGEIYNFRDIRRSLDGRGHRFRTQSDGEVIAHLYEEYGPEFTGELNGMFAIALWDEKRKRLVLARDRAGEKPLYYWHENHTLVFASEIKAILEYPEASRDIDPEAIPQYLFYGYIPSPRTIFSRIKRLPAGHRLVAENGNLRIEAYWRLKDHLRRSQAAVEQAGEPELILELRKRLREAVLSRLVSDVPLGVFLSGGIDSSTLAALMSELAPGQVNTFSVTFRDKSFNEEVYAQLAARRFHTQHHTLLADERALSDGLYAMAEHMDEPLADPALIPTFLLSRFARSSITVALSGEGSDEIFGGYPTYLGASLARYYLRLPRFFRQQLRERLIPLIPVSSSAVPLGFFLRRFLSFAERSPAERHQIWFGMFSPAELDEILGSEKKKCAPSCRVFAPVRDAIQGMMWESNLAEALYLDFCLYLADDLLVKIDRASMACSLEVRAPFLDHRLIEFAAGIPAALKLRHFQLKYLLKKAVEVWLPREIVYRQKRGFSVPIAQWLRHELRPMLEKTLCESRLKREGFFNPLMVRRLIEEHCQGRADHRKTLWTLLMFELWHEHWA